MADLISRAAAVRALASSNGDYLDALERIERLPAMDAAPVVHGLWDIQISEHYADRWQADAFCSRCEFEKYGIWAGFFPGIQAAQAREITRHYALKVKLPKYCENCGAKMDGETNERREAAEGRT